MIAFTRKDDPGETPPDLYEERQRFWWEPPDKLREETEAPPPSRDHTTVLNGELWWIYSADSGAVSNVDLDEEERARHGAGGGERFKPLLDPSPLMSLLDIAEIRADGARIQVRATPRDDLDAHWHFHGVRVADEVELEVDADTGVIRRMRGLLDGEELWVTELEELVLNEPFPDGTFVFVPPPGEEVLPPESTVRREYTLEQVADETAFPVFFIPELPEGQWRLRVNYHPPRRRPARPAHVWLLYSRADGRENLSLAQRPAGEGGFGWTGYEPPTPDQVEHDGITYSYVRRDENRGHTNAVVFELAGTSLQLQSAELDVDTLLQLARALEQAQPPSTLTA